MTDIDNSAAEAAPTKAAPAKADPETLVLRASPARVTRFKRGTIIGIAGVVLTLIAAVAWFALKSVSSDRATKRDSFQLPAQATPDAIAGAPKSYDDVPPLGPPLPGDLGRPILEHQRGQAYAGQADDAAAKAAQEAEVERERIAAEQRAARESGVMMQTSSGSARNAPVAAATYQTTEGVPAPTRSGAPDANGQQRKNALVGRANNDADINPHILNDAASPWTLQAGSIIAASLITGLNSDLPGLVTAQITENAYDSVTGRTLLIPQGSRLVGSYDSVVAFGQSRALLVWQRIILPDGSSIRIDNVPATDTRGYAGLSDRIDRHTWRVLKGVVLSTLLGVGTELGAGSSESDLVRALRESTQQAGARAGDQLVAKSLDVQPTLKVRPGWPLRVVVHKDLVMRPWRAAGRE